MTDIICSEIIKENLPNGKRGFFDIKVIEKTESTNTLLRTLAEEGASEGTVIVAGEQTSGRGRKGRSFFSPGDTGVYLSLLLRPEISPEDAVQITTAAAVAVCSALEKMQIKNTGIKWVNDVFIDNKKVCGILTEASFNTDKKILDYAILGVGINVYAPEDGFPEELKDIAGFIFEEKKENLRNKLIAAFLDEFESFYSALSEKKHYREYVKKSIVIGKKVDVISYKNVKSAIVRDINENCNLIVEYSDGEISEVNSGEISVKL